MDAKAQASGYHLWAYPEGTNIFRLSTFPTDVEINQNIAPKAPGEADSLSLVLRWLADYVIHRLARGHGPSRLTLHSIHSWAPSMDSVNNNNDEEDRQCSIDGAVVYELGGVSVERDSVGLASYKLAVQEQQPPIDRPKAVGETMEKMAYATMSVLTNDAMKV